MYSALILATLALFGVSPGTAQTPPLPPPRPTETPLPAPAPPAEPAKPDSPSQAATVRSQPGATIRLSDEPILACRFADSFGHWLGDLVAPVVAGSLNNELKSVRTGPGFECRNRNRATTGKLSAHAEGLAIDIAGFDLADGTTLRIKPEPDRAPDLALAALRTAACGWFTTILGPGSGEAHHDHLHVDIEQHGSSDRYRICQ